MGSLFNKQDRENLLKRIGTLSPDAQGEWGTLTVAKAVTHMNDQLEYSMGLKKTGLVAGPKHLRNPIIRFLIIKIMPWPRGKIDTIPEMLETNPKEFDADKDTLKALIQQFPEKVQASKKLDHPVFGTMSGALCGTLCDCHTDFHLKQFGV